MDTSRTCTRCGKKHLGTFVWLELNALLNRYEEPGTVPTWDSQGLFPFGKTCAYRALAVKRFQEYRDAHPDSFTKDGKGKWVVKRTSVSA